MQTSDTTVESLERALAQMESVLAAIRLEQADLPTPCAGWTVRELVGHVIGQSMRNFAVATRGENTDWGAAPDPLSDDWAGEFRARATPLLELWHGVELEHRTATLGDDATTPLRRRLGQQITELAVHAWDLSRAIGRDDLDQALAEVALDWAHQMLRPEFRGEGKAFGAAFEVPADGPPADRLAGWFGRDPGFTN